MNRTNKIAAQILIIIFIFLRFLNFLNFSQIFMMWLGIRFSASEPHVKTWKNADSKKIYSHWNNLDLKVIRWYSSEPRQDIQKSFMDFRSGRGLKQTICSMTWLFCSDQRSQNCWVDKMGKMKSNPWFWSIFLDRPLNITNTTPNWKIIA